MAKDLTTTQAAQQLSVSRQTVFNMIMRGTLRAFKLDPEARSVYVIPQAEVDRVLKMRKISVSRKPEPQAD